MIILKMNERLNTKEKTLISESKNNTFKESTESAIEKNHVSSKFSDLKKRFFSASIMLSILYITLKGGPTYCAIFVFIITCLIFKELINLTRYQDRNREINHYYLVSYYIFFVFVYLFYGLILFGKINNETYSKSWLIKVSFVK
jgi:predicted CDP-diglyceride synthetase/phosphatidate cytidylyltransferase